ncbi:hypothetical protein GGX14DRAFT_402176 [Mycena pura]|uniref:Uncharacterized protein n=1 Tax=Mycena pura TaxID=153505 RepID=A0AAD6UZ23_9AGAR|nr:hypothetical protein GGX14DRAFT_402176 [Mycena pura]
MPSFSSLVTVCFVSALCSLSVHGRAVKLSARQTAASNPLELGPFSPGSTAMVTSRSHALYTQKVVVTGPPAACTLQGSGEDKDMPVLGSNPTSTQCTFAPTNISEPLPLTLLFQFSPTGPDGEFTNSPVVVMDTNTIANVISMAASSEDSTDNDMNDSQVTITVVLPPNNTAPVQPTNPNTTFPEPITTTIILPEPVTNPNPTFQNALVESGMRFTPTDRIALSVGRFDGDSTMTDFHATTDDWNKVTGEVFDVKRAAPFSNVLVMRFLFRGSTKNGLKNSGLLLNGVVTYTGARPTGTPSGGHWYSKVSDGPQIADPCANDQANDATCGIALARNRFAKAMVLFTKVAQLRNRRAWYIVSPPAVCLVMPREGHANDFELIFRWVGCWLLANIACAAIASSHCGIREKSLEYVVSDSPNTRGNPVDKSPLW